MPFATSHGVPVYYECSGEGRPVVFSHGLGGQLANAQTLFAGASGLRLLLYDNRTHGRTPDAGDPSTLTFQDMAEDMAAVMDAADFDRAVIGGVSMGAAISTAFALRHPERATALILSRPAWLAEPVPPGLSIFPFVADLIERHGREGALAELFQHPRFLEYQITAPAAAESLRGLLADRSESALIASFRHIPASTPFHSLDELRGLTPPALVIGNHNDPVHPFEFAEAYASALPNATLRVVVSKSEDTPRHEAQFREAVATFLESLPS